VIAKSSESGVEFLFVEIKLRNRFLWPQYTGHPTRVLYIIRSTVIMVCRLPLYRGRFCLSAGSRSFFVSKVLGFFGDVRVMLSGERSVWKAFGSVPGPGF
jgi:hypothetical protein